MKRTVTAGSSDKQVCRRSKRQPWKASDRVGGRAVRADHVYHAVTCAALIFVALLCTVRLDAAETIDFNRDVRPILSDHCLQCHGPDLQTRQADLRVDVAESLLADRGDYHVIDRQQPLQSALLDRITSDDPDHRMPPPDWSTRPSSEQIDTLRQWILQGAKLTRHWAFVPAERPEVPRPAADESIRNPIDAFVIARLEAQGWEPSKPADRSTLIRRVSLSLTGLPPTPEQVDAFLADTAPGAYERVVDRLLGSPRFGEHLALGWLEAARYADTAGYQADWERFMWPWRDWVVQAINENMPFDQFTIEQLAGDMLPAATMSQRLATGFNRNHRINDEGGSLDAEFEVEYVIDRVDTTATVWLGLTAGCARCHDHKYDPLSQREFYQLYAYFDNVPEKGIDGRKGFAVPHIEVPNPWRDWQLNQRKRQLAQLQQSGDQDRIKQLENEIESLSKTADTPVMVMQEQSESEPTYLLVRGAYDQPDTSEALLPSLPEIFVSSADRQPKDRLELARWIVGPDNPLTARVIVNRIWQHHFGVGLVKSSEDFGLRGDPPTHPRLLDWLATELVRSGWDVKAMHRRIVTSATYRQSADVSEESLRRDPHNRYLARGPRWRLSGAAIRDQALAISGLLCEQLGGPSVKPYQPPGLWKELSFGTGKTTVDFYIQDIGSSLYRRSLYSFWKRTVAPPAMAIFDGGGREMCRVRSERTNTPLQALTLQNDITFVEAARQLAQRMLDCEASTPESGRRIDSGLRMAWRSAVSRQPSDDELQLLRKAFDRYRSIYQNDPDAAANLLSNGASTRHTDLEPAAHAAMTMVALTILNLDETVTQE